MSFARGQSFGVRAQNERAAGLAALQSQLQLTLSAAALRGPTAPALLEAEGKEAVRLAAEALREETAVRRDVIEALHRRVEELERELAMRAVQEV